MREFKKYLGIRNSASYIQRKELFIMTKQEIVSALELLYDVGIYHSELTSELRRTVWKLEQLNAVVITFKRDNWQNNKVTLRAKAK
ncbi:MULTISPECIES: hypothetical protein [Sphingobacterium]|uniref:Uncharacterized protein n=1 Tax=Sphingobacterium populi TaxID=1812824 RepID=A0ABW5U7I6_9SPHI|nr:hypothetical protein [Sphingobacterium sp. CFCC 11742]